MTDRDTLLALNQAFYRAFTERNMPAMEALWAERLPISCIHPGWAALFGREAVLASWRDVLRAPSGIAVHARNERVTLHSDTALVLCEEMLGDAVLAATNLFARENGQWRLAHHQAGPIAHQRADVEIPVRQKPRLH
ncbi:nuclear transport factor 2 family protein [Azospirillum picis]|uniref:Nuclease with RNAse H fold n=1 Tax=Azospirillum picis TaxID=488438 RepID=A0ABU0MKR0_9PROT|nr:nuclear transport factor 2 family protein [Azospirillum picis]MBP2300104.1 putative nuclease with RNAse H fold [Azospirillum picis]MDQ0534054.1 putative nuclease with RNAse H fold [Azospirillum picis]